MRLNSNKKCIHKVDKKERTKRHSHRGSSDVVDLIDNMFSFRKKKYIKRENKNNKTKKNKREKIANTF